MWSWFWEQVEESMLCVCEYTFYVINFDQDIYKYWMHFRFKIHVGFFLLD